ncbi:MAG: glycosyltransferase family 2 protein, partial [Lentisphaeria bacterium]|nr:glycosyltransferase family 2 protein [Lentisphaeria bacterium]
MKTAVVVPTLNAVKRGFWYELLRAIAEQRLQIDLELVVDSESSDQTVDLASALGWKCLRHHRGKFNHGRTRARIVRYLASKGFDTVIFLSQDVVLSEPDTLKKLTDYLWKHPEISGCCGKQISLHEKTLNAWQRERCYPNVSRIRTAADIQRDGLMAAFFSNAFAAWKIQDL